MAFDPLGINSHAGVMAYRSLVASICKLEGLWALFWQHRVPEQHLVIFVFISRWMTCVIVRVNRDTVRFLGVLDKLLWGANQENWFLAGAAIPHRCVIRGVE